MSDRFVITVRQGVASDLHPARLRLERRPELLREGTAVGAVGDPRPDRRRLRAGARGARARHRGARADRVQPARPRRPSGSTSCAARRPTSTAPCIRCSARSTALERGAYLPVSPQLAQFYRDVNDHLKLVNEEVVAQRDLLAIVLQANMAVISVEQNEISVRQNETAKRLTLIATIFLPLTFITGFFGMNFGWLAGHIDTLGAFLLFGVGSFVGAGIILLLWFRTGHPAGTERLHESPRLRALIPTDAATPPPSPPDPPESADAPAERRAPTRT